MPPKSAGKKKSPPSTSVEVRTLANFGIPGGSVQLLQVFVVAWHADSGEDPHTSLTLVMESGELAFASCCTSPPEPPEEAQAGSVDALAQCCARASAPASAAFCTTRRSA